MQESNGRFNFPVPVEETVVETDFMREIMNRTMVVHPGNSLWYGESRVGKTTTARHIVQTVNQAFDPYNPYAFRAVHYEVGGIEQWSGNEQKKGLKSLYNAALGRIDEGLYRSDPVETIVEQLIFGLKRKNIQQVFVDEAGNLSLEAIRGILMAYDSAKNHEHPLSIIFVGMDDLPTKVMKLPQVKGRIHEWCYFEPYSLDQVTDLLAKLNSHFADLELNKTKLLEQVECIYEMCGGYPGLIIPFLRKLERYQKIDSEEITTVYLRAIHLRTTIDRDSAINKSREIHGKNKR
jgi:Cdc6-like AAA superfamily ATPase